MQQQQQQHDELIVMPELMAGVGVGGAMRQVGAMEQLYQPVAANYEPIYPNISKDKQDDDNDDKDKTGDNDKDNNDDNDSELEYMHDMEMAWKTATKQSSVFGLICGCWFCSLPALYLSFTAEKNCPDYDQRINRYKLSCKLAFLAVAIFAICATVVAILQLRHNVFSDIF